MDNQVILILSNVVMRNSPKKPLLWPVGAPLYFFHLDSSSVVFCIDLLASCFPLVCT